MTRFIPRITIRRAIAGTLVATLAAVPLAVSSTAGAANTVPRCTTRGLEVWLGVGGGGAAAGSTFYPMEFSNVSRHTCQLLGFPGVSAEKGGHQVGRPAGRDNSTPHTVTLHPGTTAHVLLQITDVGVFTPAACKPVTADTLRVFPPGATRAAKIPFRFRACSASGPVFLHVTPVRPRVGIPGH